VRDALAIRADVSENIAVASQLAVGLSPELKKQRFRLHSLVAADAASALRKHRNFCNVGKTASGGKGLEIIYSTLPGGYARRFMVEKKSLLA